ncbi:MAG: type II toxin-antitoxin system RelE/ParE family toxin [Nitrospira sp.]|nr:type II toxin-antitoxin system RelE/ParE family toxin [Nitrospira sp.]
MATVKWTQRAKGDLQDVYDFIARDSPRAADALVDRIIHASGRLAAFPESGRIMPEFPSLPY